LGECKIDHLIPLRSGALILIANTFEDFLNNPSGYLSVKFPDADYQSRQWLEIRMLDYYRFHKHRQFLGWNYAINPLALMSFNRNFLTPSVPQDILDATHEMITRGNEWYGVAHWPIAEFLFQTGLQISISSNNVNAAIQNAVNLMMCYLGGGSYENVLNVADNVGIVAEDLRNRLYNRILTMRLFCYISLETPEKFDSLVPFLSVFRPDERVYDEITNIYQYVQTEYVQAENKANEFKIKWQHMKDEIKKYQR